MTKEEEQDLPAGFDWWRRTLAYKTGLGLSEEEKQRYEADLKRKVKDAQCKNCHEWRDFMLQNSPTVRFMIEQIEKVGGNMSAKNIICAECDEMKSGGFHPQLGILLCQNKLQGQYHTEDTLAHELVHAYDHCKFDVDWMDLRHHACSEIRASSLSGECRMMNQMWKYGFWTFGKGHQACVKRRATLSVRAHPKCKSDLEAATIVNQVFDSCFSDTRPFDSIYR